MLTDVARVYVSASYMTRNNQGGLTCTEKRKCDLVALQTTEFDHVIWQNCGKSNEKKSHVADVDSN